jgi:hypothetical protein
MMFYVIGGVVILPAAVVGYIWRQKTQRWWRLFGGIFLVLLPIYLFMLVTVASNLISRPHVLHSRPPDSDLTYLEGVMVLTLLWGPGWAVGVLCGYGLRAFIENRLSQ